MVPAYEFRSVLFHNQIMFLKSISSSRYHQILTKFPQQFSFCFAYGSGVKKQLGYENAAVQQKTMIDLIFAVDDPVRWHSQNLQLNSSHYSAMKYFGHRGVAAYQCSVGAKLYTNTLVPLENGQLIKYGVIATHQLIDDLCNWSYLYVAGRLHKPIEVLHSPANATVENAICVNLKNAIHTSCLLLPESFSFFDLFYTISNLSYAGDFRMIFGEKKDKVKNIVTPQLEDFYQYYLPTLSQFSSEILSLPAAYSHRGLIIQNKSPEIKLEHLQNLPKSLLQRLCIGKEDKVLLSNLASNPNLPFIIAKNIKSIVWNSSVYQSLKNIPTAGVTKAVQYSWKKILKTFNV